MALHHDVIIFHNNDHLEMDCNQVRRCQRLKNKKYDYSIKYERIDYDDLYPEGAVVHLKHPTAAQKLFPWGIILKCDPFRIGDRWELQEHHAFKFGHINHHVLLNEGKLQHKLKSGAISLRQIDHELHFEDIVSFENYLLRQERNKKNKKMQQLQATINTNNTQIIRKHQKDINGSLNSVNYDRKCGAPMWKGTIIGLAGFLLFVRYPIRDITGVSWAVCGSKPNRKFTIDLKECNQETLDKYFKESSLLRSKQTGRKVSYFKAYNITIKYVEKTIRLTTHFQIAYKHGSKGRWKYTG